MDDIWPLRDRNPAVPSRFERVAPAAVFFLVNLAPRETFIENLARRLVVGRRKPPSATAFRCKGAYRPNGRGKNNDQKYRPNPHDAEASARIPRHPSVMPHHVIPLAYRPATLERSASP
ncbi:hypothetical protein [Candidatus Rhodoblastus alkanivorans]|uniref:hypothetical protein n=1 Tax=Candidatus Rhodoblastus alkanivorans TaxID=2954117 RepID=UPI001FA972B2|nr:hypothetical protein [Candidatus Rhodoblastus alkanivorans]